MTGNEESIFHFFSSRRDEELCVLKKQMTGIEQIELRRKDEPF
jgi:hypothetical protein